MNGAKAAAKVVALAVSLFSSIVGYLLSQSAQTGAFVDYKWIAAGGLAIAGTLALTLYREVTRRITKLEERLEERTDKE